MKRPNTGWHYRGYLPHYDQPELSQFITFRLNDSLPQSLLLELRQVNANYHAPTTRQVIEKYLDRGSGNCLLSNPGVARIVKECLLAKHDKEYNLHAWVIMPNHVHVLLSTIPENSISNIIKSWKSISSRRIYKLTHESRSIWQRDYFDRYMKSEKQFAATQLYIEYNPVKAGLVRVPGDWLFSSARKEEE